MTLVIAQQEERDEHPTTADKRRRLRELCQNGFARIGFFAQGEAVAIIDRVKDQQRYRNRDDALNHIIAEYERLLRKERQAATR